MNSFNYWILFVGVTGHVLSPSSTSHVFSRWSTSRLSSGATSTSTSPCGSTRSSFNYRQPYLGWRSQERLSRPRTPAERLAADLLAQKKQVFLWTLIIKNVFNNSALSIEFMFLWRKALFVVFTLRRLW